MFDTVFAFNALTLNASGARPTVNTPTVNTPTVNTPTVDTPMVDTSMVDAPMLDAPDTTTTSNVSDTTTPNVSDTTTSNVPNTNTPEGRGRFLALLGPVPPIDPQESERWRSTVRRTLHSQRSASRLRAQRSASRLSEYSDKDMRMRIRKPSPKPRDKGGIEADESLKLSLLLKSKVKRED